MSDDAPNPAQILQVGLGFWASKTLLSAVELGLFTQLAEGPRTRADLEEALGLHRRGSRDFLDALVALRFLVRDGDGDDARYGNTRDTGMFLNSRGPAYVGGLLTFASTRLWGTWTHLTDGLRTGRPQNAGKETGASFYDEVYADPQKLAVFMKAMEGVSLGPCLALAEKFDFGRYATLTDAGGATGLQSICVARRHPHLRATTFDLPPVAPVAREAVARAGLTDRIAVASGDFFRDPLPKADVVVMGQILHNWDLAEKRQLIRAAWEALPDGGAFVAIESVIDDARKENAFGLLMSLNMLVETVGGFDYTGADFARWCREAGFARVEVIPLVGAASAAVAYK
jgi:hypothetical protein